VAKVASNITCLVTAIRGEAAALSASRLPSEPQLRYARTIAEALGVALPANAAESFSVLQAFLDQHAGSFAALPPSPVQLAFAEKVAAEKGITLPEDARTQRGV
jgi:DNA topoisomerase III